MTDDPMELVNDMTPEERATLLTQDAVMRAGFAFISTLVTGDLAAAWSMMHPDMRLAWVQHWQYDNREALGADVYDLPTMAAIMAAENGPEHPLWTQFARVMHRNLVRWGIGEGYGLGSFARPVGPDLELLHVHQGPAVVHSGESALVVPLLMVLDGRRWRPLALGSATPPIPGYPPDFG